MTGENKPRRRGGPKTIETWEEFALYRELAEFQDEAHALFRRATRRPCAWTPKRSSLECATLDRRLLTPSRKSRSSIESHAMESERSDSGR